MTLGWHHSILLTRRNTVETWSGQHFQLDILKIFLGPRAIEKQIWEQEDFFPLKKNLHLNSERVWQDFEVSLNFMGSSQC